MANAPSPQEFADIKATIGMPKLWVLNAELEWVANSAGAPPGYKLRAPLAFALAPGIQVEGLFLDAYFKDSMVPGVPPKLSLCLVYRAQRVLGLDDNGPSTHYNCVGVGMPYYHQRIDHPHLHFTVADAYNGYAEPLPSADVQDHWTDFMARANILEFPAFAPPQGQMGFVL